MPTPRLLRAKSEARGSIRFFDMPMDTQLRDKRALQQDLRKAVEHDELELHYQPQANIDGTITGFEALARWHHPRRGLVPPTDFIPLAEESGIIGALGEWVLRTACREAASWPQPLYDRRQSVAGAVPARRSAEPGASDFAGDRSAAVAAGTGNHRRRADRRLHPRGRAFCAG